ncbi:MAG: ShlB/FhaC/HecB family hemolysin secretion/activation protein [Deltaproteobacteria bacterium]|nr:ShlB/FhaC/HecB family hemolysin secretion/activation protein [Deltaproteobacteria bacterium]
MRTSHRNLLCSVVSSAALATFAGPAAWAQQRVPQQAPVEREFEFPEVESEGPALIPLPPPPAPEPGLLAPGLLVEVREFRITGNTVFSAAELAAVVAPYTGRQITSQELQEARRALTSHYTDRGYVNSGAIIPDQDVGAGVIELRVVEGHLTDLEIEGNRWFRTDYLERRLLISADEPLQIDRLERLLKRLQNNQRIRRVNAELAPGGIPGEAILRVLVEEELPFALDVELSNHESPAIGEVSERIHLAHENLSGRSDVLEATYGISEGLNDLDARYELPFTSWDTRLELHYWLTSSEVTEAPFGSLDIKSRSETAGIGISQPFYEVAGGELRAGVTGEWRRSRSRLLGSGFDFPGTGADDDGESRESVLRIHQQWVRRGRSQVFAVRSSVSVGLDILNATRNSGGLPDGQFVSWLAQLRWAQRFDALFGTEFVFRTDLQLSSDPLMPLEQFPIGGHASVRAYRETETAMDQGVAGSLEARIPLVRTASGHVLHLAPFFDAGRGWNRSRPDFLPRTLISAGVGLRYGFGDWLRAEFYWGEQLKDLPVPPDRAIQDRGIYFRLSAALL